MYWWGRDYEKEAAASRMHGFCVPRPPKSSTQQGSYCSRSGKRIRMTDGYCNDCVRWGA